MLHAAREWLKANSHKSDVVLLQTDVSNAFNTVLPEQFLQDVIEHFPASTRFAEYCYGEPTRLVYRGELAWCERGQQGCPMMGPLFYLNRCRSNPYHTTTRQQLRQPPKQPHDNSKHSSTIVLFGDPASVSPRRAHSTRSHVEQIEKFLSIYDGGDMATLKSGL